MIGAPSIEKKNTSKSHFKSNVIHFLFFTSIILITSSIFIKTYRSILRDNHPKCPEVHEPSDYTLLVRNNLRDILDTIDESNDTVVPPFQFAKDRFQIVPELKLNQCPITKTMSTVMMNVMCYLFDTELFIERNESISTGFWDNRLCLRRNEVNGHDELLRRLPYNFNTLTIVREPLSRFVSGYLDKCRRNRKCFNCHKDNLLCIMKKLKESLFNATEVLPPQRQYQYEILHLAPQTWYCSMAKIFQESHFVKYGSGPDHDRMVNDLTKALEVVGVAKFKIDYVRQELSKTSRTIHATEHSSLRTLTIQRIRKSEKLMSIFWDIFQYDYMAFGFSISSSQHI